MLLMLLLNDLPLLADLVTKMVGIAGFLEPLEVEARMSIRRTTTAEMTEEGKQSANLGADGKPLPYVHNAANFLTELNKRGLKRLAYWGSGGKEATNYLLNQVIAEYLTQYPESQWPIPSEGPVQPHVDASPKVGTHEEPQPGARRSQRKYNERFKLAVVGEVGRGEFLNYKQAQQHYGIQGRTTVLTWCRRYATHFANSRAARPDSVSATSTVLTLEQRIEQLEIQSRQQMHGLS